MPSAVKLHLKIDKIIAAVCFEVYSFSAVALYYIFILHPDGEVHDTP